MLSAIPKPTSAPTMGSDTTHRLLPEFRARRSWPSFSVLARTSPSDLRLVSVIELCAGLGWPGYSLGRQRSMYQSTIRVAGV